MLRAAIRGWRNLGISVALVKFTRSSKIKKEILSFFDNKNAGLLYCYMLELERQKKGGKGGIKLDPREVEKELGMDYSSFLSARDWLIDGTYILPTRCLEPGAPKDLFTIITFPYML